MANSPPVATINDQTIKFDKSANVVNWLTYSDADGNPATKYQFWDSGAATNSGYFSAPGVIHHPANTTLEVTASNLSKVKVHGGAVGGSETLWVRAFDGRDWGAWDTFTLTSRLPIVGTNLPDLIDGSHTPLGQPLPSVESDFIYGLGGADTLFGLDGIDTLTGGLGKDILVGGLDADIFDFNRKSESTPANRDVIGDFSGTGAELDRIDLSGIDAKAGHGNQSFHWIGPHKFHHRVGELQVKYNDLSDVAIVSGDIDGNGRADFQIEVYSAVALAKGDFIL
jgi:Peptidase M10 serralysin C terminal